MSNTTVTGERFPISRRLRFVFAFGATLIVALGQGAVAPAFAADNSGGRDGGSNGGHGSDSGRSLIVYGTPGNCPPTVGCGNREQRRVLVERQREGCGEYIRSHGRLICIRDAYQ